MSRHRIALTGGPCGGKSTALPILSKHYQDKGFKVYTIPEVATLMHMSGVDLHHKWNTRVRDLEEAAVRMQLAMEDSFYQLAMSDEEALIICDRGVGDLSAYTPPDVWGEILESFGLTYDGINERYGVVVHLVTAAMGAEKHFTNENNPARKCTPDLAKALDRRTFHAWAKHPNRHEIDNSTDFDGKMKRTIGAIDTYLSGFKNG